MVLHERPDRPTALLAEVEQQQLQLVRDFQPGACTPDPEALRSAQRSRERSGAEALAVRLFSPCVTSPGLSSHRSSHLPRTTATTAWWCRVDVRVNFPALL